MPTPRGGGLIFILVAAVVLILNLLHPIFKIPNQLSVILLLAFACALLGFSDDESLRAFIKFKKRMG
jgi:UDP-N-acetylmuramyl pentapeptide phosphotransferase/UDP-N-acetylglucosamine-1-phosphate transferase